MNKELLNQHKASTPTGRSPSAAKMLQRKCACGGSSSGECEECKKKELHRKPAGSAGSAIAPQVVHRVLSSPGTPLDAPTRSFFEPRFGHNFSKVRIHADHEAARSAHAVNALAYTVGNDVVFGAGRFSPNTKSGQQLLAHELTHVVQQSSGGVHDVQHKLEIGPANDLPEQEADRFAQQITSERGFNVQWPMSPVLRPQSGRMQRATEDAGAEPATEPAQAASAAVSPEPATQGVADPPKPFTCPQGYALIASDFRLTSYVRSLESEFPDQPSVTDPCGLKGGTYRKKFLDDVKMQGSGQTVDGQIIRYTGTHGGRDCFTKAQCALGAIGRCITPNVSVAVDPTVIPLGTKLYIQGVGERRAEDTGDLIKGHHIDLYIGPVPRSQGTSAFGRSVCKG